MGQVVGEIDLRALPAALGLRLRARRGARSGPRRSLQFFDATGTAIHKVYATKRPIGAAFDRIAADAPDPSAAPARFAPPAAPSRSGPMPKSTSAACARPGRRSRTPTSSSCCCAASGSAARRRCGSPDRTCARPARAGRCARLPWNGAAAGAADHGLRRQPRLRANPFRARPPDRAGRPVAQRARSALQPPLADRPRRERLGGAQAVGERRHPLARALRRGGRARLPGLRHARPAHRARRLAHARRRSPLPRGVSPIGEDSTCRDRCGM